MTIRIDRTLQEEYNDLAAKRIVLVMN